MQSISTPRKISAQGNSIVEGEHLVGEFIGDESGPTLVVFGSVHGNEPSGLIAMRKAASKLQELGTNIKGRIYFLAGNTRAIKQNVRFIDCDLNRNWTLENINKTLPDSGIATTAAEDQEQRELLEIIERVFSSAKDEVYAMDLHSTSAKSTPFAMIGDTLRNRTFAQKFPATFLLGIEEQLDSTILEYINNLGAVTLGFEAGQHTDKTAIESQEALIWLALLNSGILSGSLTKREKHEETLRRAMGSEKRIIEIRHRHAISSEDGFKMKPGYENFQQVRKGEHLAEDKRGEIRAKETSLILMPLYQSQGNDGFFLGREISPFWLWLSRVLRKLNIGNLMRFLPGVKLAPNNADSFVVNTRIARVFPLQIFHLLGFRKRRWKDEKLVVSRRKHDTKSPFYKHAS